MKKSIQISLCNRLDMEIMPQVRGNSEYLISVPANECETLGIESGDEVWVLDMNTGQCVAARAYRTNRFRLVGVSRQLRETLKLEVQLDAAPGQASCRNISLRISPFRFDIALSYASQQRSIVSEVSRSLTQRHVRVMYDVDQSHVLLASNLLAKLPKTFAIESEWCAAFFSSDYFASEWTKIEFESVMKEIERGREMLIPIMLSETELPQAVRSLCYSDAKALKPAEIADRILKYIAEKMQ